MDLMDYRRKIIANSPHLKSASGAVASFSDGADLPLNSLNVNIEPVQSGSGDPSPTNIRPISGWNAVNVKNGNTVIATISLGQTVYGGTLNPLTGVLTVTHGMLVKNTSTMDTTNDNYPGWFNSGIKALVGSGKNTTLNCLLNIGTRVGVNTNNVNDSVFLTKAIYGKTKNEWIALAMDVQIVVELATPIEIQLTPHQIRSLYGNNTIFADTGNVALEYWAHA